MNNIKKILVILSLLYFGYTNAQDNFEIIINQGDEFLVNGKTDLTNNYILIGKSYIKDDSTNQIIKGSIIVKVDSLGNYFLKSYHFSDTICIISNVLFTSDSNYIFVGSLTYPENDSSFLWLLKTDTYLNTLYEKVIKVPLMEGFVKCILGKYSITNNNNFILSAIASNEFLNDLDIMLIEINESCELTNYLQLNYNYNQSMPDLAKVPNSSDIIAVVYHLEIMGPQIQFIRLDSSLSIKSIAPIKNGEYKYDYSGTIANWINDTTFLYTGLLTPNGNPIEDEEIGLSILDTNYNAIREKHIGTEDTTDYPAYINSSAYFNDTCIYVLGFHNYIEFWPDEPNKMQVYRVDTSLNILDRYEFGGDAYYRPSGIIATNDGGCLIYGSRYGPENDHDEDIHILKIAPEELITSASSQHALKINDISVFPNPTKDILNIEWGLNEIFPSEIIIRNIAGFTVLTQKIKNNPRTINIDCHNLVNGTYTYSIVKNNKILYSGKFIKN